MAKVSNWHKFSLLVWKNWIIQWQKKCQLVVVLLLPAIFSLLLVFVRTLVKAEPMDITNYTPQDIKTLALFNRHMSFHDDKKMPKLELLYSPTNSLLENIVKDAAASLNMKAYRAFSNAAALEKELKGGRYLTGVQFDDALADATDYPEKLAFSLRFPSELRTPTFFGYTWRTLQLFSAFETNGPRNRNDSDGGIPVGYLREGFIPVQNAISMSFLKLKSDYPNPLPEVIMQRYPYPTYFHDPFVKTLADMEFLSLIILLSFIYPCIHVTKYITAEKEKQLKEVMKMMGLPNWIHWTAWFVKCFTMLAISAVLITALIKIKWNGNVAVLTFSAWSAIFFFLLIYIIASICFCFMLATFFFKASTAAAVASLTWFFTYYPYSFTMHNYQELSLGTKLGWCLISNTAMGFAIKVILGFECTGEGLQWSNMFTPVSADEDLTLGAIILVMLAASVIYMLICLYVEQIMPGDYGVAKKWNFPFTAQFWRGDRGYVGGEDSATGQLESRKSTVFEREPLDKHAGVQVKNLKKTFGDKTAVKDLSLNMYEDEITVLLGHNGAGKTTTISMLTGMFPPTSGTAIINGYDIRTNLKGARMSLGICPQHNVLFDDMSVANHIVFFSRLKGVKGKDVKKEVLKYLKMIGLENKAREVSSKLSGGMQRKLSICCALCGNTKVVFCDEPSSGMDPAARRQLWDLLQAEKIGRTMLLTTHYMEEADVLGDRIAIMCDGELQCYGTSFFLKKKYGSGYSLTCVKGEDCNVVKVTALVSAHIPGIQPESNIGNQLSYRLPDSYSSVFENIFRDLEKHSAELHIDGFGIGVTSLEEVFMKVGAEKTADKDSKERPEGASISPSNNFESGQSDDIFNQKGSLLKGSNLCLNQWKAMMVKKMLSSYRHKLLFCIQNIMPIIFVVTTILISRSGGKTKPLKPMTMDLKQYPRTVTLLDTDGTIAPNSLEAKIAAQYKDLILAHKSDSHVFKATGTQNFAQFILELGKTIQVLVNSRYLAAATVAPGKITAWLNNQPYHTAPLTVNLVHNAMARALIGPQVEIKVTNAPLPYSTEMLLRQSNIGTSLGFTLAENLCFCMCFVSSFYILFLIKERESRSKLLQFVSGVRVWTFWLSHLLWDMTTYIITALVVIIAIVCFQENGFSTFEELGRVLLVLLVFGFAVLPVTYIISFFFQDPATGFLLISIINILTGLGLFMAIVVMTVLDTGTAATAETLVWYFRIFPHFAMAMAIFKLAFNAGSRKACSDKMIVILPDAFRCQLVPKCCTTIPYFDWDHPGILPEIVYMVAIGVVIFLIIILREFRITGALMHKITSCIRKKRTQPHGDYFDDDVDNEKKRIQAMTSVELSGQNLVMDRLSKYYGKTLAVNQVSLAMKEKECFGLLGVNGAGKTTIFKMMTGDVRISSGHAYIKGMNLESKMNKIYKEIGCCPQFDALIDNFTGREHLRIFCLLRGINKNDIKQISEEMARSFGFMKHIDKISKVYSGGNKRKLSAAIAVLGGPTVIFMDEPTSGMDPATRRQLWNIVSRIRESGRSIILTSHSMEECEALCTRLAIMVNGEFKCIGSAQHLKNKFSKGLVLKIKVQPDVKPDESDSNVGKVKEFVKQEFPQAVLQEEYQGILTFYIPLSSIKWSEIFGLIERNRKNLRIEDYYISQTTLEEVFLEFSNYQRGDLSEIKSEDPREIKTEDPREIKREDPREIKTEDPREIKREDPRESEREDPRETEGEDPRETEREDPRETEGEDPRETEREDPRETEREDARRTK